MVGLKKLLTFTNFNCCINRVDDIPEEFLCQISHELIRDPRTTACGHTFDSYFLLEWFKAKQYHEVSCPCCRAPLELGSCEENPALRQQISSFLKDNPSIAKALRAKNQRENKNGARLESRYTIYKSP